MKQPFCIALLIGTILLGACSPSPDQLTTTAVAALAQTQTALPTATASQTATPTATYTVTPTATFTPTATNTSTPTPTIAPTPVGGGSGRLIFACSSADGRGLGWNCADDLKLKGSLNIFISNWDGSDLTPITNGLKGWNYLEDISPDGHQALVSSFTNSAGHLSTSGGGDLYLINLDQPNAEPKQLANYIIKRGRTAAAWMDNTRLAYVGLYGGELALYSINADGSDLKHISQAGIPLNILAPITADRIFWSGFTSSGVHFPDSLWWTSVDGTQQEQLPLAIDNQFYDISPDKTTILIFGFKTSRDLLTLTAASINDIAGTQHEVGSIPIQTMQGSYAHFWSPDGQTVVYMPDRTHYSRNSRPPYERIPGYVISLRDNSLTELPIELMDQALDLQDTVFGVLDSFAAGNAWSPDGQQVVLAYWVEKAGTVTSRKYLLFNPQTREISHALTNSAVGWGVEEPILWLPASK